MSSRGGGDSRVNARNSFIREYGKLPVPDLTKHTVPAGACDCHAHVFGPWDQFPLAPERTYTPEETPGRSFLSMLDVIGVEYGVLVQPTVHGVDNACMLNALSLDPHRLKGVAVVPPDADYTQLKKMKDLGVEGIRLSDMQDAFGNVRYKNIVPISAFKNLKKHLIDLDMHVQFFVEGKALPKYEQLIREAGIPIVIDHMGRPDVQDGIEDESFNVLCRLLAEGLVWVKATQYRPSLQYPYYEDVRPFFEKMVSINPDQLVWGSDWPHINLQENIPNPGALIDLLFDWSPNKAVATKILCDNPKKLYKF